MSISLENWGKLQFTTLKTEGDDNAGSEVHLQLLSLPKGKERVSSQFVSSPIVDIPISSISSASSTTKNDLSILIHPNAAGASSCTDGPNDLKLTSVRFAIPDVCVGYEQTEEAGRVILAELQTHLKTHQQQFLKSNHADTDEKSLLKLASMSGSHVAHEDEVVIGIFDDVTLSYPSGKYKIVISNYNVVLEDRKKGTSGGIVSFPLDNLQQLYLCDVPTHFTKEATSDADFMAQYVVLILKKPIKIRATTYAHIVISCPVRLVLDEDHPWCCELKTQEEINKVLGFAAVENAMDYPLVPAMSGRVCDILIRTFKAVAKVPAYSGVNKEYNTILTQNRQSCMRCYFHGTEGLLYMVSGGFLFLHRPATRIALKDVLKVTLNESEDGSATFQIAVITERDKYVFSGISKAEKENMLKYLEKKVKVQRIGLIAEGDSSQDDDDNNDDDEDEDDDDDDEEEEDDGNAYGDSDEERSRKHQRKEKSENHPPKKHRKEKHKEHRHGHKGDRHKHKH